MRFRLTAFLFATLVVVAATSCSEEPVTGPEVFAPLNLTQTDQQQCDVIDFNAFSHGNAITSVSLFGGEVNLSVTAFRNSPEGAVDATAYDTERWDDAGNPPPNSTHNDTQRNILCNDADNGGKGTCDGIMAVVPDPQFADDGDDSQGGSITFSEFPGGFTWTLPSYAAMDDDGDQTISLFIDGSPAGASTGQGNASVETVTTTGQPITIDAEFTLDGSGGIDDIEVCREPAPAGGRMTGGGGWLGMTGSNGEDVRVTHGFTVHCDVDLTNNLNINWPENHVKIEKEFFLQGYPICTDEPDVNPEPPPAPFDTFEGKTVGTLNGVAGAEVWFILQDSGEPGGKADKAAMQIKDPDGNVVLTVGDVTSGVGGLVFLEHGNAQAHFDQPHGCNVNKPC